MPDPAAIDAFGPHGIGLRVEFKWAGDRYAHLVRVITRDDDTDAGGSARSLEGAPSDDWPTSPALQQLLIEARGPERRVALLVGMSGASHWSACVEPVLGAAAFDFDVACRVRLAAPTLQSSYEEVAPEPVAAGALTRRSLRVTAEPAAEVTRSALGWSIQSPPQGERFPCTVRWRYRISIAPP